MYKVGVTYLDWPTQYVMAGKNKVRIWKTQKGAEKYAADMREFYKNDNRYTVHVFNH